MITEAMKEKEAREKIENGIKICEEAMAKSEKYERLKDNKDWQAFLGDLQVLSDLHDREIKMGESMILDAPNTGYVKLDGFGNQKYVSSRQDWIDFIVRHQTQKAECSNWIKEPKHILTLAAMAREKLPMLKDKLKEYSHVSGEPSENGKP